LPYATVFNLNNKNGTAAGLAGNFTLPNNLVGDSIRVSFIGYEDLVFVVSSMYPKQFTLYPKYNLIDEIVIRAEDDYLYTLISNLRKNKSTELINSKTYLFLETSSQDQTIEVLEGYYNGEYQNGICADLKLKKGRIGIKPIGNRYFLSTESSKLFSLHDHFRNNKLLPHNPFEFNKRKLRKKYALELNKVYTEGKKTFYDISFEPKKNKNSYFSGHIVFDINSNTIQQIEFTIKDSEVQPFIPIGGIILKDVNMKINKTFYNIGDKSYVDVINFSYDLKYSDRDQNEVSTSSEVFIKTYNQPDLFNLPHYNFSTCYHKDYRDITLGKYDSIYWQKNNEFRFYEKNEYINEFVQNNFIENNFIIQELENPQLEFNYEIWDPKRIIIKEASSREIEIKQSTIAFEEDRYNLNVKLFLDITKMGDQYKSELYSTIDPINTYYYFYITDLDQVFINIYFDLMEIEKRELKKKLSNIDLTDQKRVTQLYNEALDTFNKNAKEYCDDVNRGKDFIQLSKWNNTIYNSLNIDNLELFGFKVKND
jgi:hypothetical protein